jgi:hypothetical protein
MIIWSKNQTDYLNRATTKKQDALVEMGICLSAICIIPMEIRNL